MVYIITAAFILLDLISGVIKALKSKSLNSSVMRDGVFKKAGSVLIMVLGALVDYGQAYIDLGVSFPISLVFCGIIIMTEVVSIIENACTINPDLMPDTFKAYFEKLEVKKEGEDNGKDND